MSWQDYIDTNLVGSGKISSASIIGHDGIVWATSADFNVAQNEAADLMKAFKDPSGIRANGLYLNNKRFIALNANDRSIYGKLGTDGVVCVKTARCVLIGYYANPIVPGDATMTVENLADYLISSGF